MSKTAHRTLFSVLLFIFQSLTLGQEVNAQLTIEWDRTFGGAGWEELNDMIRCTDQGYLLAGMSVSSASGDVTEVTRGGADMWILKTDKDGNKLWDKRYGGSSTDKCVAGIQTSDGGYILGGFSDSPIDTNTEKTGYFYGDYDYWLVKIDGNGNYQWDITHGGNQNDKLFSMLETSSGYLLGGYSTSNSSGTKTEDSRGGKDFWVVKTDYAGNKLWDKTYGADSTEWLFSMAPAHGGGYLLGGMSFSGANGDKTDTLRGMNDYWLVKIDEDGNKIWDKTYGGEGKETLSSILPTGDDGYLLFGNSSSDMTGEKTAPLYGSTDVWLLKINNDGDILWQQSYGGSASDRAYAGQVNGTGNILINAVSTSGADGNKTSPGLGENDFWIIYTDSLGNKLWDKSFGGEKHDSPPRIYFANDGGYIIGGHSDSDHSEYKSEDSRGSNDFWMIKTYCPLIPTNIQDTIICKYMPIEYNLLQKNCPGCTYRWNDGNDNGVRTITANSDGIFNVTTVHPDGCSIADTFSLTVAENPEIKKIDKQDIACYGSGDGLLHVKDVQGGLPPYRYAVDEEHFSENPLFRLLDGGDYVLTVSDARGCLGTYKTTIDEPNEFIINIGQPDYLIHLGDSVQLQITSSEPIDTFIWENPELVSCFDCLNPYIKPIESRHYQLTALSKNGCKAGDFTYIAIDKQRPLYLPNIFSPNGDGNNDYFMVRGNNSLVNIKKLSVFNRWGNLVFTKDNINPHAPETDGWDGTFGGTLLRAGVYVYRIEADFTDGTSEVITGTITLVR